MHNDEIYFPSAMENNQTSLGPVDEIASNQEKLNKDLANLKNIIDQTKYGKFFVFITEDNISDSVVKFLDLNLKKVGEIIPEQPHMSTWISEVMIYERK